MSRYLLPNHYALTDGDGIFDTAPRTRRDQEFTIQDTAGCSCEQILDRTNGGNLGQQFFGCSVGTMRRWIRR
jgi:hypothetical protein